MAQYSRIDIRPYVETQKLAQAILSQTGTKSRTIVGDTNDYRILACELADQFFIRLSEELLREAMELHKREAS